MATKSETALNALHAAIFTTLNGNVTYNSSNVPVFDHVPQGTAYPYVEFGSSFDRRFETHSSAGRRADITIQVWTASKGTKDALGIAHAVDVLLDRATPTVSGYRVVNLMNVDTQSLKDETPEGLPIQRAVLRYEAIVQET